MREKNGKQKNHLRIFSSTKYTRIFLGNKDRSQLPAMSHYWLYAEDEVLQTLDVPQLWDLQQTMLLSKLLIQSLKRWFLVSSVCSGGFNSLHHHRHRHRSYRHRHLA
jgi:hypothetical protein